MQQFFHYYFPLYYHENKILIDNITGSRYIPIRKYIGCRKESG